MPISYDDAYNATNPDLTDEQRKQGALAIVAGTAANEAYWNSRSDLEALRAQADGHGVVVRDATNNPPTESVGPTANAGAIDAEVVSDSHSETGAPESPTATLSNPDNPQAAIAALRKQITDSGGTPEA